ncbi:MAG: DUF2510 domain-containing protein, partial [Candidatus Nanopelagicales bacterium]|nr:DUF2510 domain-containing protein [Candidatus Nanopelagicales bacterium]
MTESGSPVAGWYADPQDGSMVRWWDGVGWTDHTQSHPGAHSSAVAEAAP